MNRNKSKLPFVNLHGSHTTFSAFDGFGYPEDHMRFAYQNGLDALAITDHGHMNAFGYQIEAYKKLKSEGINIKPIYGMEGYHIPCIEEWKIEYEKQKTRKKELKSTGTVIENEGDVRKKQKNIINQRSHLLLLCQNQKGLNNLFKMISISYSSNYYYRYPRIDYDLLKKYNEGIIATSGCLGGILNSNYWKYKEEGRLKVLNGMKETVEKLINIFGDRFYGELQWNNIPEQHELNNYVIQLSKEYGFKVISTVDAHYPTPDSWRDREIYKRLGFINKKNRPDWLSEKLPNSVEEIGFELYPKNGDQVFESYKHYSEKVGIRYDDEFVKQTIINAYDIATERIEEFLPDNTIRLPNFVVPKGKTEEVTLAEMCVKGLKEKKLHLKKEYVDRMKHEIKVIQERKFSRYFLTMKAIVDRAKEEMLVSPGRGSASGSLLSYLLGITQIDPLKYNLQFERFLRKDATDHPDIDVDFESPMHLKESLVKEWGDDTVVPISNWTTLQLKSLIKDISKFYKIPFIEVNEVTTKMMKEAIPLAKQKHNINAGVYNPNFEEVMEFSDTLRNYLIKYPKIKQHIESLHGQIRQCFSDRVNILTNNGYKTINEICKSDAIAYLSNSLEVCYNNEFEVYFQGEKEIYKVELEDGIEIELTADHKVLTQDGYKEIKELNIEKDYLFTIE